MPNKIELRLEHSEDVVTITLDIDKYAAMPWKSRKRAAKDAGKNLEAMLKACAPPK